jgi:hypothetical protein
MSGSIYSDGTALADIMSTTVKELLRQARALGLTWTLRLATVVTNAADSMTAQYDGDTAAISMVNITGTNLQPEERVYVLIIPPSGNFIIGRAAKTGLVGRVDSNSYNNGDNAAEIVILTLPTTTFTNGRTYRFRYRVSTATTGPATNQTRIRIRVGTTILGTIVSDAIYTNTVGFNQEARYGAIYAVAKSTFTTQMVLTQQALISINTTATASATNVFYLEAEEVGPAANYPSAFIFEF